MKNKKLWKGISTMFLGAFFEILGVAIASNSDKIIIPIILFCVGVGGLGYGSGQVANFIRVKTRSNDISIWGYALIAGVSLLSGVLIHFIL